MVNSGHLRRLLGLAIFMGLVFVGLAARLVDVQVINHEKYQKLKRANTVRSYLREPRRGDILDINGNPLATSIPSKRVLADPSFLGDHWADVARALAPLLAYDEAKLAQMLRPTIFTNTAGQPRIRSYVDLHRKVSVEGWQQITQTLARLNFGIDEATLPKSKRQFYRYLRQNGIYAKDAQIRTYPNKALAAHVVGYTLEKEEMFNDGVVHELTGEYGIEKTLDNQLTGVCGWRRTETDNRRREIPVYREQDMEPRAGLNVVLTIDIVIQNMVEQALAEAVKKYNPVSAQAVVVRPRTGEILAMATLPNFDPNEPGKTTMDHLRNRVIADMIEPGSTFKVVTVSGALNERMITLNDTFDCERGRWLYAGKVLHDTHGGHGVLTVEDIIAKSSNIGTAKIAIYKLEKELLYKYIRAYGFGSKTGIPLLGELGGWVHPLSDWARDKVLISRLPIGQSITVTPLQMVMAYSAIANGGRLMRPMLIHHLLDSSGQIFAEYQPVVVRQVISESAARQMTTALKKVTTKDGTAAKAALEHYTVAGKTGTAWKTEHGQYVRGKYVASFIGFFPTETPEVCIGVVLDEPDPRIAYYGGQTTAPIFAQIAEQVARYLQIRPDRDSSSNDPIAATPGGARTHTAALRQN